MNTKHTLIAARQGLSLLAEHETNALGDHLQALNRRLVVASKARSLGELLRDQIDLLPDTRARLNRDHDRRRSFVLLAGAVGLPRALRGGGDTGGSGSVTRTFTLDSRRCTAAEPVSFSEPRLSRTNSAAGLRFSLACPILSRRKATISSCSPATSGRPRKRRNSSGLTSISTLICMGDS